MKGAKVNMEKARREGLCYGCGLSGHQARNCRKQQHESGRNRQPVTKIRMMRSGNADSMNQEDTEPNNLNETNQVSPGLTQTFEGLTLDDFATEPTSDESSEGTLESTEERIKRWAKDVTTSETPNRSLVRGYRGRHQTMGRNARIRQLMTSRVPGRQPDGLERHRWIPVNPIVPQGNEQECSQDPDIADESTREYQPLRVEESPKIIEASLAKVDFERLRKVNRPGWRDYCREPNPEETEKEIDRCTCYGFYQKC